jgi:hypothetical protein
MKWQAKIGTTFLSIAAMIAGAQSSTEDQELAQETQVRGYWVDPSTRLMWAGKDSGKDLSWKVALKYCRNLRLAGYSDWRLANVAELQGIYDKTAEAPGLTGRHSEEPDTWARKGGLISNSP